MEPVRQTDARPGSQWANFCLSGALAVLACFAACSSDLTPGPVLLSTRVQIVDSTSRDLLVEAPTGAAVRITVSGHGVDVRASITGASADTAAFADAPNRRMGVETLLVEATQPRVLKIRIERNDHSKARGHADVTALALPLATESDQRRLEAARLEAKACLAFPDIARGQATAEAFTEAAQLHAKNSDRRLEGLARLHAAGVRYSRLADWAESAALASQAASILERAGAPEFAAFAVRVEGAALDQRANASGVEPAARERYLRQARERLTAAFEQFQTLGNSYEAGYALNYRGVSFHVSGDGERARKDYRQALNLFRSAGDGPAQALSLQSLALLSFEEGRLSDAMREFDEALALIPRDEDPENYAHTLNNSALPFRIVGRFDEAIARYHEAGEILHARGDKNGEARALHGLGITLMHSGEPERAAELLEAAIRLRGETGTQREQAISLLALGEMDRKSGRIEGAIAHDEKALALVAAPHDLAQAKLALARAHLADNRLPQARRELEEILQLDLPHTHHYLGLALAELGGLESMAGRNDPSRKYFDRALKVLTANGSDLEYARTLILRAEAFMRIGNATGVISDTKAAIDQLETIGLQALQAESRAAFRASYRDAAELQIAALLAEAEPPNRQFETSPSQQALEAALAVSDRSRAKMLAESEPARLSTVSDEILDRRRSLFELLAGKRLQRDRLQMAALPDEGRIAELTREIAHLRREVSLLDGQPTQIRIALGDRIPSVASGNLAALVPENSVVAEYFIGRTHVWLFEVRKDFVEVYNIGSRIEIEELARDLHLTWRNHAKSATDRMSAHRTLSLLLFGKLKALSRHESLYLIPDGPLHLIPMVLLAREFLSGTQPGSVHSATTLAALHDHGASGNLGTERLLAVVADPIYSADDSRIRGGVVSSPIVVSNAILTRHARDLARLKRLPSTAVEAKAIAAFATEGSAALTLVGADATRRNVADAGLDRYRIVHFATHAFADSRDPALATLALSRFDQDGN
ncbi:MAG TPA: tetratricopeptide repeat protein, partial [Steroidobacteraceae bacterium]